MPWIPVGREHGVVAPVRTDATGERGPTKRQAASDDWRRSSRGLYVPAHVPLTPQQRVVEAAHLVPMRYGVTGWGSLCWLGCRWMTGVDASGELLPVDIAAPGHPIREQAGIHVCEERYNPRETLFVDGITVAAGPTAVCFAARYAPNLRGATVALSMAAYDDVVSLDEAAEYVDAHPSYTGIQQGRDALPRAQENFWSPMEVHSCGEWEDTKLGFPLANRPVFTLEGRHLGTPDLIDPVAGVIGQYDGVVHLGPGGALKDAVRDEVYEDHGLECAIARAGDIPRGRFAVELRNAYRRASRRPASDRRWTLELPDWWVPTFTVAQRRALTEDQRRRWLRYRDIA